MRKFMGALTATLCALACAGAAQASWGPHYECAVGGSEDNHCYAISVMGQNVNLRGGVGYFRTQYVSGLKCNPYGFITNEEWLSFPGKENYIETGQQTNCEEGMIVHPFYAGTKSGHQYAYTAEWAVPFDHYNGYWLFNPCPGCGPWGAYWEGALAKEWWGYPTWGVGLQNGLEIADNSEPHTLGRSATAAVYPDGTWHNYNSASFPVKSGGLCVARNTESSAPGNIVWSTCRSGTRAFARSKEPQPPEGPDESQRLGEVMSAGEVGGEPAGEAAPAYTPPSGSPKTVKELEKIAKKYAKKQGKATRGIRHSAPMSLARATATLDPESSESSQGVAALAASQTTYTFVLEGSFTSRYRRPGDTGITGSVMGVVVNARSGFVTAQYIGDEAPQF